MVYKKRKGPPPIVYIVITLLVGYGLYYLFSNYSILDIFQNGSRQGNQPKVFKYEELENTLQNEEWRQADWLTWKIMSKLGDQNNSGWLTKKEIKKIPCSHLQEIDKLWQDYSNNKFGFSIQKKIYENLGGRFGENFNIGAYRSFAFQIGWIKPQTDKKRGGYRFYKNLTFDLEKAPRGHLPAFTTTWMSYHSSKGGFVILAKQLEACQDKN